MSENCYLASNTDLFWFVPLDTINDLVLRTFFNVANRHNCLDLFPIGQVLFDSNRLIILFNEFLWPLLVWQLTPTLLSLSLSDMLRHRRLWVVSWRGRIKWDNENVHARVQRSAHPMFAQKKVYRQSNHQRKGYPRMD